MRRRSSFDPVTLEIYRALYTSVAEEMGVSLRRTAFSPNIKERRDYSCAVFDAAGRVIAQGDHMPVHLGSMPAAVAAALDATALAPGDVVALNDPFAGGTHLPDVTLVAGVFLEDEVIADCGLRIADLKKQPQSKSARARKPSPSAGYVPAPESAIRNPQSAIFYVANRAHHADIGGASPGSMGMATDVYGEGLRIPPVKIVKGGREDADLMRLLLANVRGAAERRADFEAQTGSLKTGASRLLEIVARAGSREASVYAAHLIDYSARRMRAVIREMPDGVYEAEDALDGDGVTDEPVVLRVRVTIRGERARVDFRGSAAQVAGPVNAVEAITLSAVSYVFRCLVGADEVPASAGLMEPIEVVAPLGSVVNAEPPAAVAGGNVETSQRIVDVLFRALARAVPARIPAASQGTMNNLTVGGVDLGGQEFAYYETVAGGMGARATRDGMSAVHTHMTNSLNTPAEALEYAYPLRVRRYAIREGSGGEGATRGGDGVVREIETLVRARASLLADRRALAPYGLAGGGSGSAGRDSIVRRDGTTERVGAKGSWQLEPGDRVRIETPGGGGHGKRKR
ncbi:MAG: hydantoinase B/oxoprolinase family protein [Acidobacteria bacterium]|nr:hydantoinase B/oxoprolinase family protein [Acidobacteriota bacterium]MCA1642387.1 hydantoinase B/oxoprolinase family protein [Acidobacteriota bacterium]